MSDWNAKIIEEFRTNDGRVGGAFEGANLLLLHTTGARSRAERVNPLMYLDLGGGAVAIFASKAGAPTNPDWYHNLLAHPLVLAEIRNQRSRFRARVAEGDERERLLAEQTRIQPAFGEYQAKTDRSIPVFVLEPVDTEDVVGHR
jgi:deazaflavin-dependent oxidoreductase (nitroreductase family)